MYTNQSSRYSTLTRLTRLGGFALCLFSLFFAKAYALPNDFVQLDNQACDIQLKSIQATKDQSQLKKQNWVDVQLPDFWESRWKGYSGTVLYRIQWTQYCQQHDSLALSINSINMAGQVYLNGQLIWKDQALVEPLSRSWNIPRYWILPSANFNQGENTLLVKVVGVATQSPGLGVIHLGSPHLIVQAHNKYIFQQRTIHFINLVMTLMLGIFGFLIWLLRRQDSTFGWFALASIIWSIFICGTLVTETPFFADSIQYAKFNMWLLLAYTLCFSIFTWRFAAKRYKKIEYALWAINLFMIPALIFPPLEKLQLLLFIVFLIAMGVFVLNCIYYQWIAFKSKQTDVRILALTMLGYIVIICHDIYKIITRDTSGFMGTPLGGVLMTLALSLILGWRIAQNITKIETFNEQLEIKIDQVKSELECSLDNKHQLEIENMRLQERLNLAHDLHDGLGGSLVRSMALVDRADSFDKQRFMSILKLLRNDLRQIIDSGSSIGAKVPETPIIWGAPLRHRYIQLFEEMEIESTWQFPAHWQSKPTALECLTLARVTEEALTNIVKHSHATVVEVSLCNIDNMLILKIKDNGVGFDPSTVQAGLHVGLHSMQIRVNRIGGSIRIVSRPGDTQIKVIIPQSA